MERNNRSVEIVEAFGIIEKSDEKTGVAVPCLLIDDETKTDKEVPIRCGSQKELSDSGWRLNYVQRRNSEFRPEPPSLFFDCSFCRDVLRIKKKETTKVCLWGHWHILPEDELLRGLVETPEQSFFEFWYADPFIINHQDVVLKAKELQSLLDSKTGMCRFKSNQFMGDADWSFLVPVMNLMATSILDQPSTSNENNMMTLMLDAFNRILEKNTNKPSPHLYDLLLKAKSRRVEDLVAFFGFPLWSDFEVPIFNDLLFHLVDVIVDHEEYFRAEMSLYQRRRAHPYISGKVVPGTETRKKKAEALLLKLDTHIQATVNKLGISDVRVIFYLPQLTRTEFLAWSRLKSPSRVLSSFDFFEAQRKAIFLLNMLQFKNIEGTVDFDWTHIRDTGHLKMKSKVEKKTTFTMKIGWPVLILDNKLDVVVIFPRSFSEEITNPFCLYYMGNPKVVGRHLRESALRLHDYLERLDGKMAGAISRLKSLRPKEKGKEKQTDRQTDSAESAPRIQDLALSTLHFVSFQLNSIMQRPLKEILLPRLVKKKGEAPYPSHSLLSDAKQTKDSVNFGESIVFFVHNLLASIDVYDDWVGIVDFERSLPFQGTVYIQRKDISPEELYSDIGYKILAYLGHVISATDFVEIREKKNEDVIGILALQLDVKAGSIEEIWKRLAYTINLEKPKNIEDVHFFEEFFIQAEEKLAKRINTLKQW